MALGVSILFSNVMFIYNPTSNSHKPYSLVNYGTKLESRTNGMPRPIFYCLDELLI